MTRTALFLSAALYFQFLTTSSSAETLTAIVIEGKPEESEFGRYIPETAIVDIDTTTGEISKRQRLVGNAPGTFTALERNSEGTLYGITDDNTLVTLDETTGNATTISELSLADAKSFSVKGLAFVPGESETTLFALVSTVSDDHRKLKVYIEEPPHPFAFLATVDLVTGELTDTGYEIGGNSPFAEGHGIDFHPLLGKIVHGFNDFEPILELIDPETGTAETVADVSEEFAPYSYDGIACGPNGSIFVYEEDDGGFVFRLDIVLADPLAEHGQIYEFSTEPLYPLYIFEDDEDEEPGEIIFLPFEEEYSSAGSLELNADGWLVTEIDGSLRFYPSDISSFEEETDLPEEIPTSIHGIALTATSIAVHPVTGDFYALTSTDGSEYESIHGNSLGINIVDRAAGEVFDVGENEVNLISDMEEFDPHYGPPLAFIVSIAFDHEGNLFGINPFYGLVAIDTETGVISATEEFGISEKEAIAYHPSDSRFYIFTTDFEPFEKSEVLAVVEFIESSEDFDVNVLELSGDIGLVEGSPTAATYWKGRLYFSTTDFGTFYEGRGEDENLSVIYSLSLDGSVLRESSVGQPILALAPPIAPPILKSVPQVVPDVLVGEMGAPLVGGDIYTPTGAGQAVYIKEKGKKLAGKFVSRIENDGDAAGQFTISSTGGSRSDTVKYFLDGANVSAAMRSGLATYLPPGAAHNLSVKYERDKGTRWNTEFHVVARTAHATDVGLVYSNLKLNRKMQRKMQRRDPRITGF